MYSYELNTFGPQLQDIVSEAHKHLGKKIFVIVLVLSSTKKTNTLFV
jgi:hypothetical protein